MANSINSGSAARIVHDPFCVRRGVLFCSSPLCTFGRERLRGQHSSAPGHGDLHS